MVGGAGPRHGSRAFRRCPARLARRPPPGSTRRSVDRPLCSRARRTPRCSPPIRWTLPRPPRIGPRSTRRSRRWNGPRPRPVAGEPGWRWRHCAVTVGVHDRSPMQRVRFPGTARRGHLPGVRDACEHRRGRRRPGRTCSRSQSGGRGSDRPTAGPAVGGCCTRRCDAARSRVVVGHRHGGRDRLDGAVVVVVDGERIQPRQAVAAPERGAGLRRRCSARAACAREAGGARRPVSGDARRGGAFLPVGSRRPGTHLVGPDLRQPRHGREGR